MRGESRYALLRRRMVETQLIPRGIDDQRVLDAMATVPRHLFVQDALGDQAYGDHPLPIGLGQTISQPYIVARMTQALELEPGDRVLEIGTGSGYQAAVLAHLCQRVYTVERLDALLAAARRRFDHLKLHNIVARIDDGTLGWPEEAPFDAIMVTAGGPRVPDPLMEQLAEGGRMIIPVGGGDLQHLLLLRRQGGELRGRTLEPVRFVDLVGAHGHPVS